MRPAVSVILPFHGTADEARQAQDALLALDTRPGDELVVVDNSGVGVVPAREGIRIVTASDEHSAYYARNVGCATVDNDWLLFVDADCRPAPDILERYFDRADRGRRSARSSGRSSASPSRRSSSRGSPVRAGISASTRTGRSPSGPGA